MAEVDLRPDATLLDAAKRGDAVTCRSAIRDGADVNTRDSMERSPLHWACAHGHSEVVRELLDEGADHNAKDATGHTCLHLACFGGIAVVEPLLMRRADLSANTQCGQTCLHIACGTGDDSVVEALLAAGADKRATDFVGRTCLHTSAASGHPAVAELLIGSGADVLAEDLEGRNAQALVKNPGEWPPHLIRCLGSEATDDDLHRVKSSYEQTLRLGRVTSMLRASEARVAALERRFARAEEERGLEIARAVAHAVRKLKAAHKAKQAAEAANLARIVKTLRNYTDETNRMFEGLEARGLLVCPQKHEE